MPTIRTTRTRGVGVLLVGLAGLGLGGCSSGSARTDYFASRAIVQPAQAGDGSVIAIGPGTGDAAWSGTLTFEPVSGEGDLADRR